MVAHGLTWTDKEVVALFDVWSDASVQVKLQGAYRNDHIYRRIVSELAACRFQHNVKQCRDKLKALKKKYKEVINRHGRSGAGVESDEEVTQGDFRFFLQIHRVLRGRAVVNPPHLLEIGTRSQSPASSELATPLVQSAVSMLRSSSGSSSGSGSSSSSSSSRPSTLEMLTLPPPAMAEVETEDTQGTTLEQPKTETSNQQPETEPHTEQPETEPATEQPETVLVTEQPVPETAEQSIPGPSHAKKRKLMQAERAQKEVSATLSKLEAQVEDLKSALILLDDQRAKQVAAEQMKREEERESRMLALLTVMMMQRRRNHLHLSQYTVASCFIVL